MHIDMNNNNNNNNDATIVPTISINDSPVKTYLRSIGSFPVLTADEEKQKFIDYKAVYDKLPKLSDDAFTVDDEAASISPLYNDYLDMREELINDNLKLVVYIAKRYRNNHLSYLDLIQEGNLGLIEAIDRFNPELGFRFSTFATPWIKQAIIKAITDKGKMVRIPAHIFQLQKRCRDAENELMQEDANLTPSDVDIARKLHERVDKVELARKNMTDVISMDSKVGGDDDGGSDSSRADSICDFVADDESLRPDEYSIKRDEEDRLYNAINSKLPPRSARIIKLRYGVGRFPEDTPDTLEPHTLEETGDIIGLTRERVRQLEKESLSILRSALQ